MKDQTPEERWTRLQRRIQEGILKAYPNPERRGCPGGEVIRDLAIRSAGFDDSVEDDPRWQHVTHCSPCYGEYLDEFIQRQRHRPTHWNEASEDFVTLRVPEGQRESLSI